MEYESWSLEHEKIPALTSNANERNVYTQNPFVNMPKSKFSKIFHENFTKFIKKKRILFMSSIALTSKKRIVRIETIDLFLAIKAKG